jgi:hypothetical protein
VCIVDKADSHCQKHAIGLMGVYCRAAELFSVFLFPVFLCLLQVDCTAEAGLCRQHIIQGFPSIRVFRKGHDDVYVGKVRC